MRTPPVENRSMESVRIEPDRRQWWTAWQLWLIGLLLAVVGIGAVISIPYLRRSKAIAYLREHDCAVACSRDDEWITERFGRWARPFRRATTIRCLEVPTRESWPHIQQFQEVECMELPIWAFTWETREQLQSLPNLKSLQFQVHTMELWGTEFSGATKPREFVKDDELYRAVVDEWTTTFSYGV